MTPGELVIREMIPADIPPLLEIERVSFPVPWDAAMFNIQRYLSKYTDNLVILSGDSIIGYISSWYAHEELHILSIAIAPADRGGGGAAMLLARAVERSREKGCLKVVLEVRVSNSRAIRFYEKHGFRQVDRRKNYYPDSDEDALILARDIGSGIDGGRN